MDHHCHVPRGLSVNTVIPLEFRQGKLTYSQCERYVNLSGWSNETVLCDEWYYDTSELQSSIVSEVMPKLMHIIMYLHKCQYVYIKEDSCMYSFLQSNKIRISCQYNYFVLMFTL